MRRNNHTSSSCRNRDRMIKLFKNERLIPNKLIGKYIVYRLPEWLVVCGKILFHYKLYYTAGQSV